jgi:hypothetical protein
MDLFNKTCSIFWSHSKNGSTHKSSKILKVLWVKLSFHSLFWIKLNQITSHHHHQKTWKSQSSNLFQEFYKSSAKVLQKKGVIRELNPRPLAPKARIIPLDQSPFLKIIPNSYFSILDFLTSWLPCFLACFRASLLFCSCGLLLVCSFVCLFVFISYD